MFYLMTGNKKRQRYPLRFIWWRPIKRRHCYPLRFIWYKTTVLPLTFCLTGNKKRGCYPVCFIWWRLINDSVTPYVLLHKKRLCYPLRFIWLPWIKQQKFEKRQCCPLRFIWWRRIKKRQCYPLRFISWKKRHCYPLDFIWWRRRQNDSVTPYVLFDDDGYKITVLPLMFYFKKKITVTLTFYLMTANKKQQHCYPLRFIRWRR